MQREEVREGEDRGGRKRGCEIAGAILNEIEKGVGWLDSHDSEITFPLSLFPLPPVPFFRATSSSLDPRSRVACFAATGCFRSFDSWVVWAGADMVLSA